MSVGRTCVKEKLGAVNEFSSVVVEVDSQINGLTLSNKHIVISNSDIQCLHNSVSKETFENANVSSQDNETDQKHLNTVVENLIIFSPDSPAREQLASTQKRQRLESVESSVHDGSEQTLSPQEESFSSSDEKSTNGVENFHASSGNAFPTASNGYIPRPDSLLLPKPLQNDTDDASQSDVYKKQSAKLEHDCDHQTKISLAMAVPNRVTDMEDSENSLSDRLPHGVILSKGDLIEFVAEDLQDKIRRSSPMARTESSDMSSRTSSFRSLNSITSSTSSAMMSSGFSKSPSSMLQQSPDDIPPIDPQAVINLENHAQRVSDSVNLMMGKLKSNLHKMSAISVGNEEAYGKSVDATCDSVDNGIKSMYALMAKCEELGKTMEPIYKLADQVKEIKRLLERFEFQVSSKT